MRSALHTPSNEFTHSVTKGDDNTPFCWELFKPFPNLLFSFSYSPPLPSLASVVTLLTRGWRDRTHRYALGPAMRLACPDWMCAAARDRARMSVHAPMPTCVGIRATPLCPFPSD